MITISLTEWLFPLKLHIESTLEPLAKRLNWINPSIFSFLNCCFMILAGLGLFYHISYLSVFIYLFLSYSFDVFDGLLARTQTRQSHHGSFIDASFDRLGEIGFIIGLFFSGLFPTYQILFLGVSALFTNYLQIYLFTLHVTPQRSILEKTDRNVYFFIIFALLSFGVTNQLSITFVILCFLSLLANLQLMIRGFSSPNTKIKFSIPSNPDETTFDPDYSDEGYPGGRSVGT